MSLLKKIPHDIHIHTTLSSCCIDKENQTPRNIITSAEKRKLDAIGFSDHLWMNPELTPSNWYQPQNERQISSLRESLSSIDTSLPVLIGCEAETIAPGQFSINKEFAESLDIVLLSCSHFHMHGLVQQPENETPAALAKHMLEFFRSGVTSGLATVIAHPLLPLGHWGCYDKAVDSISDAEFLDTFHIAAEHNVALEITLSFFPDPSIIDRPGWSLDTPTRFLALAKQAGCKFTFGSDAHELPRLEKLEKLMTFVNALQLTTDDVMPLPI